MSQTLVWSACNHLASDDFIPNTKNVGRWLLQTHALDNVDNIENEIRSWFLCIFRQLSASNVTAPFLDSLQLERVLNDAIDSSLLSVKVQIESFQNKQKKAHKNFKRRILGLAKLKLITVTLSARWHLRVLKLPKNIFAR